MNFLGIMMSAGLAATVLGCIAVGVLAVRRAGGQVPSFDNPGWRLDLSMCFVWGGILLVQLSNILIHKESGAIHNISAFGWAGTAGDIFICGVFAGRLLLRREMKPCKDKQDERGRDASVSSQAISEA
jgi:hypothetical protein